MTIDYVGGYFTATCSFAEKDVLKSAGFRWSSDAKVWHTQNHGIAQKFFASCTPKAQNAIRKSKIVVIEDVYFELSYPKKFSLLEFQPRLIQFLVKQNKAYLAASPGLGKNVMACVARNTLDASIVYVCPPHLARNVEVEFRKWTTGDAEIYRVENSTKSFRENGARILIVADSLLAKGVTLHQIEAFAKMQGSDGYVTGIFVDEAHRFKNDTAQRTKSLFKVTGFFDWQVFMSGTPRPNRNYELWPILSNIAPETIDYANRFEYGVKYCAGFKGQWGWDFSGNSNTKELSEKVQAKFMRIVKKSEVLAQLPPKTEEVIFLGGKRERGQKLNDDRLTEIFKGQKDITKYIISAQVGKDDLHIAEYRRELGLEKLSAALTFIRETLEDNPHEHVLIFAHHKDVIAGLTEGLKSFKPFVVDGSTPMSLRHERVEKFQAGESRVFIGQIQAAGTGLTLTKATRVVFVEFSWVDAENEQAADRAHRIGQTENVFVQYLVFENSLDHVVLQTALDKRQTNKVFEQKKESKP